MSAKQHKLAKARLSGIGLLCAGICLLAGCGGSSKPQVITGQARQTAAQSTADVGKAHAHARRAQRAAPASNQAKRGAVHARRTVQRARATPATSNDGENPNLRNQFNPCTLVSRSEAQAIVGGAIAGRTEARLGPTCIYKLQGSQAPITLTVESLSLAQVTHQMAQPKRLNVGHGRAYCGRLGTQMLFAPLAGGRLLNVTAPCAIAQRFAELALPRLAA